MRKSIKSIVCNKEFLSNWLSSASDWSMTYWSSFSNNDIDYHDEECVEDAWATHLLNGGALTITDKETDREYTLSLSDIEKGFKRMIFDEPMSYARMMEGDYDFYVSDILLQLSLFKKVIYG